MAADRDPASEGAALWSVLRSGGTIANWAGADSVETLFPGTARPMPDTVDYRFVNGWVATGDLPCREALRAALPTRQPSRPSGPFHHIHVADDGAGLDFSTFRHRPTLITRGVQCRLDAPDAGLYRFRLETCGGARLWIDDAEVACFEPYVRNRVQSTEVEIRLPCGPSCLTVELAELHERDTLCVFSLTYLGAPPLRTGVPIAVDAEAIAEARAVLANAQTDAVVYREGTVSLVIDPPPHAPVKITVSGMEPFPRGAHLADGAEVRSLTATVSPTQPRIPLFDVREAAPGCLALDLAAEVGGARIERRLGCTILPEGTMLGGDLRDRRDKAADLIAAHAGFEPAVAALLASRREQAPRVEAIVAATLGTIEDRHDCSDFSILPILRLWRDARATLTPTTQKRLRDAILGYRYWLDEPGDDVMWFWSENHVLCFHTAQWIAGDLFPDATFTNSGDTGATMRTRATARLDRWFDAILADGLCEWNSAAYYPIDMLALLCLHDMVPAFHERARTVLDRIFVMTALHTSGGVPAGSQGRCYEKELLAGPITELGTAAAIAFGGPFWPGYDRAAALLCLSDYAPPETAATYARPDAGDILSTRYRQGADGRARLTLWKTGAGQLSTVAGLPSGTHGHQAHVVDVQMSTHPMARLWINHPGDQKAWGERRPSRLAGNHVRPAVAQIGSTALLIYDIDRPWAEIPWTQLFAPQEGFPERWTEGRWLILGAGPAYVGVWCSTVLEKGPGLYREATLIARADRTAWVVALSHPDEDRAAFTKRLRDATPAFDAEALRLDASAADGTPVSLNFDGAVRISGRPAPEPPLPCTPDVTLERAPTRK